MPMQILENLLSSWKTEFQQIHIPLTAHSVARNSGTYPATSTYVYVIRCQAIVKLKANVEYSKINYLRRS